MTDTVFGLGLESSCDETAASVVRNGRDILSNAVYSQIELHGDYFGVVPEIASRAHLETINTIIEKALSDAGITFADLDYVAVTNRPGLTGSLLISVQSAKAISHVMRIPLIGVNHLEAHLYAPFLEGRDLFHPYIGLLVSGGNTVLYHVRDVGDMEIIGRTVDDAVGEAYDKVAKFLDLEYPGGPVIEKLARKAVLRNIALPKILPDPGDSRFSYSGIKTAVINYITRNPDVDRAEIVYAFQERALEILVRRTFSAARDRGIGDIVIAGGVASNGRLRELFAGHKKKDETIIIASPSLCTDNGAMVAGLGYHYHIRGVSDGIELDVYSRA